jgi:hypothetical protein
MSTHTDIDRHTRSRISSIMDEVFRLAESLVPDFEAREFLAAEQEDSGVLYSEAARAEIRAIEDHLNTLVLQLRADAASTLDR